MISLDQKNLMHYHITPYVWIDIFVLKQKYICALYGKKRIDICFKDKSAIFLAGH